MLAPAFGSLAALEILAGAARADKPIRFEGIAATAHLDTAILLQHDIVRQHQLDRSFHPAIHDRG